MVINSASEIQPRKDTTDKRKLADLIIAAIMQQTDASLQQLSDDELADLASKIAEIFCKNL